MEAEGGGEAAEEAAAAEEEPQTLRDFARLTQFQQLSLRALRVAN